MSARPRAGGGWGRLRALVPVLPLWLAGCAGEPAAAPPDGRSEGPVQRQEGDPPPIFTEAGASAGVDFVYFNGMIGERSIIEEMGAGGALADFDGDGDLDLYLVQGAMVRGADPARALVPPRPPLPPSDRLYRNDLEVDAAGRRTARFVDVTEESGLAAIATGYGLGVATGDYDGDGDVDLYLTNDGPNQLLRNEGSGDGSDGGSGVPRFVDVTAEAGAALGDPRLSLPAAFFDADGDGWLDLYVGNYVFVPADPPRCFDTTGAPDYCGPDSFRPEPDRLLRNRGPGPDGEVTFEEVTAQAGMTAGFGPALGVVVADFDGDRRLDLYVANDGAANNLWLNRSERGRLAFVDEALLAGAAVNADGAAEASMGVEAADFDGDGDLDLFLAHFVTETNTLYRGDGRGAFDDVTAASGLGPPSRIYTAFGAGAIDYDNDGRLDLLTVNGAVNNIEALVRAGDPYPLHQPNQLFRNVTGREDTVARFEEVTAVAGPAFARSEVSRGAVFGDLDNDGDTDVVVINNNGPARLLINRVGQDRAWLGLRLLAGEAPRDAIGAMAELHRAGQPPLRRWVRRAGSYASAHDPRLLFGLGDAPAIERVVVTWPDGLVEAFPNVPPRRYTTLERGTGRPLG